MSATEETRKKSQKSSSSSTLMTPGQNKVFFISKYTMFHNIQVLCKYIDHWTISNLKKGILECHKKEIISGVKSDADTGRLEEQITLERP